MQLLHLLLVASLLGLLVSFILKLSLFKCSLGAYLVKLSLTILSTLLELTESLSLLLFLLFDAKSLSDHLFLSEDLLALVLCDLLVQFALCLSGSFFLFLGGNVDNFGLLVHNSDPGLLGCNDLSIFLTNLLNIGKQLSLLSLSHLFLFLSLLSARSDLVNDDLGTSFPGLSGCLHAFMLSLDGLQPLDLHHHVESLLLIEPVLLQLLVLFDLALSDSEDF